MDSEASFERRKTRVLVVDDQVSISELVSMMLDQEGHFAAIAEASNGLQGLHFFRRYRPTLVIAALALPELSGPEMIQAIREEDCDARVLVFSGSRNRDLLLAGLAAHPQGFVHKTERLDLLRQAVILVAQGVSFFSPYATRLTENSHRSEEAAVRLTPKERTVLQLIAEGMSSKQAANRLLISQKTVEHHRTQLMKKLGLRDVASLTRYAVRCGLVSME